MKIFNSYGVAVCAAVLMAGGCSGSGPASLAPSGSSEPAGMQAGVQPLNGRVDGRVLMVKPKVHRDHHKSWRSPKLKSAVGGKLLFVSDFGTDDVTVYQLPKMTLVATLTGFADWPQGMCSDTSGHVWITVAHANAIYEYDNTATLVNTLSDPDGWPVNCAWDKKTGNLAVANIANNSGYGGELLVYPSGTGTPTAYVDPNVTYYYDVAYDNKSDLVATGDYYLYSPYTNLYEMTSLPKGAGSLTTLSISGGMPFAPGGLLWDNQTKQYLAGDQECGGTFLPETSCEYWVSVLGTSATITGKLTLNSSGGTPVCDMTQTVRMGDKLYGGDYEYPPFIYSSQVFEDCPGGEAFTPSAAYRWIITGGGAPVKSTTNSISAPSGVAVSNL